MTTGTESKAQGTSFVEELIASTGPLWIAYIQHPFVQQLTAGTLPIDAFLYYIKQGMFCLSYARIYALGAYKGKDFDAIASSMAVLGSCVDAAKTDIQVDLRKNTGKRQTLEA